MARETRATAHRPNAARSRARSPCATTGRRGRARRREASGRCATHGIARRKICFPHGSRSSSTRRSTRRCRGRRCMKCCAIDRAMSCSTIWVSARTRWGLSFAPTAPTCRISCAPISPSRWGCRSATRSARAAAAASRRSAPSGSTFRIETAARPSKRSRAVSRSATASNSAADRSRAPQASAGLVAVVRPYLRVDRRRRACIPAPARTPLSDDNTDYYPVPLTQETLRPGTVYADPYGHVLMIAEARARRPTTRPASSSRSMRSPTARSRASVSGAAISCSRRILRSAAPASSASGRSCATKTAACGG